MEKRGKGERGSLLDPKIDCLCLQSRRFCEDNGNSCLQFDLLFYLRRSIGGAAGGHASRGPRGEKGPLKQADS